MTDPKHGNLPKFELTVEEVPVRDGDDETTAWRAEAEGHDVRAAGDTAHEAIDVLFDAIDADVELIGGEDA
jgi:hypothetical protein